MAPLHRHQILRVSQAGWRRIRDRDWDATSSACLGHWAARDLPLVVTRQTGGAGASSSAVAVGLSAPGRWERRRISLQVLRSEVLGFDEFPVVEAVAPLLPDAAQDAWSRLCGVLSAACATARVYGSYGWQHLSGLDHVRPGSDVDVWVAVSSAAQADAVAATMQATSCPGLRLDGELVFDGGAAVAWREWLTWRAGATKALIVKTLFGASLTDSAEGLCSQVRMEAGS
ncbi:MAG: malonate decarboxylase holo-[acyl-carrier-protein] synthase [Caldimonas sp.]